jgi:hypothetical protein
VLLPAVVSFLGCEYAILLRSSARYFNLYGHLMRLIHARFHDTDLYLLIGPPSLALWGGDPWLEVRKTPKGRTYRLLLVTSVPLGLLVAFALPTFLIYAYWRLFSQIDVSDLVVSLSAAFAALNVLRTILTILEWRNLA